ncbi:hypothetical protein ACTXT7_001027 [Hymenolepis weldensis]
METCVDAQEGTQPESLVSLNPNGESTDAIFQQMSESESKESAERIQPAEHPAVENPGKLTEKNTTDNLESEEEESLKSEEGGVKTKIKEPTEEGKPADQTENPVEPKEELHKEPTTKHPEKPDETKSYIEASVEKYLEKPCNAITNKPAEEVTEEPEDAIEEVTDSIKTAKEPAAAETVTKSDEPEKPVDKQPEDSTEKPLMRHLLQQQRKRLNNLQTKRIINELNHNLEN